MSVPTFLLGLSKQSQRILDTVDPELRDIITEVSKYYPLTVITGFRNETAQNEAFNTGKSKLRWPNSKHNKFPSQAVDIAPIRWNSTTKRSYIDWNDAESFANLAGYILNEARHQGVHIRWGADWDSDTEIKDERFLDYVHFELVDG